MRDLIEEAVDHLLSEADVPDEDLACVRRTLSFLIDRTYVYETAAGDSTMSMAMREFRSNLIHAREALPYGPSSQWES